ncbi:hypothetical protein V1523DRAFT_418047 [Lipomyces doorenjongii]
MALIQGVHRIDNLGFWLLSQIPPIAAPSLHMGRMLLTDSTGLRPVKYACCNKKPCVCFTGEYEGYQECPKCGAERFMRRSMKPKKTFTYIPLEPRIRAIFSQKHLSKLFQGISG